MNLKTACRTTWCDLTVKPAERERRRKFIVSVSVEKPCDGFDRIVQHLRGGPNVAVTLTGRSVALEAYELELILDKARKLVELFRGAGCEPVLSISLAM